MTVDVLGYKINDGGICPDCARTSDQEERRIAREHISPTPRDQEEIEPGYWEHRRAQIAAILSHLDEMISFDRRALQRATDDGWREP